MTNRTIRAEHVFRDIANKMQCYIVKQCNEDFVIFVKKQRNKIFISVVGKTTECFQLDEDMSFIVGDQKLNFESWQSEVNGTIERIL